MTNMTDMTEEFTDGIMNGIMNGVMDGVNNLFMKGNIITYI